MTHTRRTETPMTRYLRSGKERSRAAERGIGAIWMAIGLTLFMSFAAMAVDIGNWYLNRTELQTAADSAALGGAALLPADPKAAAEEAARIAAQHGYVGSGVVVDVIDGSIMDVSITASVDNYFLPAIGFGATQQLRADATAEYEGNVAMGSPSNTIGNDPEVSGSQPDFTLGIEGPGEIKANGDRFSTKPCGSGGASYCASANDPDNAEFDSNGYFFAVEVDQTHGQDLVFEVFDPAYVSSRHGSGSWNRDCGYALTSTQRNNLEALTETDDYPTSGPVQIPEGWYNDDDDTVSKVDAGERYQTGRNYWCPGDRLADSSDPSGSDPDPEPDTAIIIREPDATPWNPLDNPIITQINCQPHTFQGWGLNEDNGGNGTHGSHPSAYELLDPTSTFAGLGQWEVDLTDDDWTFAEVWRRWVPVCRVPAPFVEQGKYLIQVRTSGSITNPQAYDSSMAEAGLNAFSIRAGFDDGDGTLEAYGGDVRVYAEGHLPIFANSDTANPEFALARVLEVGRDRTFTVEMFDIGDAGSLSIQVMPPADSNMTTFSGCSFDLENTGVPSTADATDCSVSATSGFNGRVMLIQVPIPDTYECNEADATGCWVSLQMTGSDLHDFTTWSAYISGDPVRLID